MRFQVFDRLGLRYKTEPTIVVVNIVGGYPAVGAAGRSIIGKLDLF
jgi:hypothetical protein